MDMLWNLIKGCYHMSMSIVIYITDILFWCKVRRRVAYVLWKDIEAALPQEKKDNTTFFYSLYLYKMMLKKQLKKPKMSRDEMKIYLSRKMLRHSKERLKEYGITDLKNVRRMVDYARNLKAKMDFMRNLAN